MELGEQALVLAVARQAHDDEDEEEEREHGEYDAEHDEQDLGVARRRLVQCHGRVVSVVVRVRLGDRRY